MQKQPKSIRNIPTELELLYDPFEFEPDFPVKGLGKYTYTIDSNPLTHLHYHNALEIGYCLSGTGIFIVDDKVIPFSAGDVSIIFQNELHIAKSNPENPSVWYFVTLDPVQLLRDMTGEGLLKIMNCLKGCQSFKNIVSSEDDAGIVNTVKLVIEEMQKAGDMHEAAVKGLVLCLLSKLSRLISPINIGNKQARHNTVLRISPVLNHIFKNYNKRIDIPKLAELCGMSVTNFRRTFIKAMGTAPYDYICGFRIRMASVLLTGTDTPVLDISMLVGYDSLSSFNRHFKKIMKMSPRDWRQLNTRSNIAVASLQQPHK